MILVIDASAALAWLFQRSSIEEAARADALLEALENASAWIPSLWYTEVANALLTAERRNMLSQAQSTDFINRLSRLGFLEDDESVMSQRDKVMALARSLELTAYDATYAELALRKGARLATFDGKLVAAMRKLGGDVF